MSILSGYKKFKKYIKTSSGFQLQSLWTSANTVEADDKRTIQTKVGAINGISSSETANSAEIAASTALTNKMNGTINNLSRDLGSSTLFPKMIFSFMYFSFLPHSEGKKLRPLRILLT